MTERPTTGNRNAWLAAAFARIDALTEGIPDKAPDESQGLVADPCLTEELAASVRSGRDSRINRPAEVLAELDRIGGATS